MAATDFSDETSLLDSSLIATLRPYLSDEQSDSGWNMYPSLTSPEVEHDLIEVQDDEDQSDTPIAVYLRDIRRFPLLTAEQEVQLAKDLESGELARESLREETFKDGEMVVLEGAFHRGEAARRRLTESNLRLVVSVARKYMGRGLPLLDLIQEGNIGLGRAVEKYDYTKGYRFSTYAYWWIRQAVTRAIADQARTVRVPVHMIELIGDVYKAARDLQQDMGREPDPDEIAEHMGTTGERVRQILRAARQPISLETPVGEEEESTIADFVVDRQAVSPEESADRAGLCDSIEEVLGELSPREQLVLKMRFGIGSDREATLGEVGIELGVSRERARQIEAEALAKLRTARVRRKLREYVAA
jgi:RNA polymerase primary sigma factor